MHNFITISNKKKKNFYFDCFNVKNSLLGVFLLIFIFLIFEKLFADFYYLPLPNL